MCTYMLAAAGGTLFWSACSCWQACQAAKKGPCAATGKKLGKDLDQACYSASSSQQSFVLTLLRHRLAKMVLHQRTMQLSSEMPTLHCNTSYVHRLGPSSSGRQASQLVQQVIANHNTTSDSNSPTVSAQVNCRQSAIMACTFSVHVHKQLCLTTMSYMVIIHT